MDILEIDAVNFAGRVAHVAAAELYGLLKYGEVKPIINWYDVSGSEQGDAVIDQAIEGMSTYVARRLCPGETLYRATMRRSDWGELPLERKAAYELFCATVATVSSKLMKDQREAEHALELATRPAPPAVKLEDTIFEPEEGLGKLRPEAVEAQKQIAAYEKARKEEERIQRKLEAARNRKEKADAQLKNASDAVVAARQAVEQTLVDGKPPASALQAMSVGEAPAKRPVNRGGRGNRKTR